MAAAAGSVAPLPVQRRQPFTPLPTLTRQVAPKDGTALERLRLRGVCRGVHPGAASFGGPKARMNPSSGAKTMSRPQCPALPALSVHRGLVGAKVQWRCAPGAPFYRMAGGNPCSARASGPDKETELVPLLQQERPYLLKLLLACTAGGIAIKYGSLLLPQVTRPNPAVATLIVFTPVVLSLLILALASQQQGGKA